MVPIKCYIAGKKRLIDFCKMHTRIFLYGAGRLGKRYLQILQHEGILVTGFITTVAEINEYCGLPVYGVQEISYDIKRQDGVILAYLEAVPEAISMNFTHEIPDILDFEHWMLCWMEQENSFSPYMDELKMQFPKWTSLANRDKWKNLLIIRLDAIGDIVCSTAFVRELKNNFPNVSISMVIRKQNELLLRDCPYIDNLFLYDSCLSDLGIREECKNFENTKNKISNFVNSYFQDIQFDAVFLPREVLCGRNKMEELLMAFYSKAGARFGRLITVDHYKSWIYYMIKDAFSEVCCQEEPMHEALFQLDMLKQLGFKVEKDNLEVWTNAQAREIARKIFAVNNVKGKDELIAVGLVGSLPVKNWDIENYKILIDSFYHKYGHKYKFILFGGMDAVEAANQLTGSDEIILNLTGKLELDVTIACMEWCKIYIGSNTGLLHIATALGKPSVTLYMALQDIENVYGGGPCRWGARQEGSISLLPPAGLDGCHGICRKKYAHCINQITPVQVEQAIEKVLKSAVGEISI